MSRTSNRNSIAAIGGFLILTLATVGCGGGSGSGVGGSGSTGSAIAGNVNGSRISGANLTFFSNANFAAGNQLNPISGNAFGAATPFNTITSLDDGTYQANFAATLGSFVFLRSTGGRRRNAAGGDIGPAPILQGVTASLGGNAVAATVSANALGSLLVAELQRVGSAGNPASTTPEAAYARLRQIFSDLPADPAVGLAGINTASPAGLSGITSSVATVLINASGSSPNGVLNLANSVAAGDTTTLNNIRTAAGSSFTVNTDPTRFFAITGMTVGGQFVAAPTALQGAVAQFVKPANPVNISGPLPTVTISASNAGTGAGNQFADGSVFANATLTISIRGTGSDPRVFNISVSKVRATLQTDGSVVFGVDQGAAFTFTGTTSTGAASPQIVADNGVSDAFTTNGNSFSFNTETLINRLRNDLGVAFNSTHPAFLIASAGTFDLSFTTQGIPFGLSPKANGFSTLQVNGVVTSGQHNF